MASHDHDRDDDKVLATEQAKHVEDAVVKPDSIAHLGDEELRAMEKKMVRKSECNKMKSNRMAEVVRLLTILSLLQWTPLSCKFLLLLVKQCRLSAVHVRVINRESSRSGRSWASCTS